MKELVRDERGRITSVKAFCVCGKPKARKRNMCADCLADPAQRQRNLWQMQKARWQRHVDENAERETRHLPKGEPLVPLTLSRLIDEWGRA